MLLGETKGNGTQNEIENGGLSSDQIRVNLTTGFRLFKKISQPEYRCLRYESCAIGLAAGSLILVSRDRHWCRTVTAVEVGSGDPISLERWKALQFDQMYCHPIAAFR